MGTTEYRPRGWVVRIPAAFVGYGSVTDRGFPVSYTHLTLPTILRV